jgi:two-component system sensor histidine kinase CpxA
MKLSIHSLFLKIFLWFWATVILTGIALILTFIFEPHSVPSQWESTLRGTAAFSGAMAVESAEQGGKPAASEYLERVEIETRLRSCLFDRTGAVIAGTGCETFDSMVSKVASATGSISVFGMKYGIARSAQTLRGASGREYIYATELPAGPRAAFGIDPLGVLLKWGVALLVSGFICYLLALYITTPILRIREASQQLAGGELSARAPADVERRQDELGDLVRDFNAMASRIEDLVSRQRQLITDVSHELRSPLARLNVALDLGRERKGNDSAFDHMEQDLGILNDLIERLLTLARLGTTAAPMATSPVDLSDLVPQIVRNAEFESRHRRGPFNLVADRGCIVSGNAQLLHSAIENVVRNAIRYGDSEMPIDVVLKCDTRTGSSVVRLTVRDFGQGVPEPELVNIFQPFYRVADARDRQSGGAGLGLAIADRVIRIHGGTIRAENANPRGLQVEFILPGLTAK